AAAVADVRLYVDISKLITDDRARGAGVQAASMGTLLADVAHHQPAVLAEKATGRCRCGAVHLEDRLRNGTGTRSETVPVCPRPAIVPIPAATDLLDEADMAPGRCAECHRVVVAHAAEAVAIGGQLVPLLAGNLTRLAANAERRVGEEAVGHAALLPPRRCSRCRRCRRCRRSQRARHAPSRRPRY